ncbi:MAG: EcsC family protein [Austwickia sp.]|nr:EcsC family protein [Austwickia sp.]MBK9101343.1 EcsC family protein [Austwickia sp.]
MGILDVFGKREQQPPVPPPVADSGLAGSAAKLVERLLDVGIDGRGTFDSAQHVVANHLARTPDKELAIEEIVGDHVKAAAAGGFLTGLGGFVTLPVALPANVAGFYIIATRMAAAIAALRGYDVNTQEVRSAVLLSLVGADSDDLLKKAGYASTGRLSNLAAQRLPGPVLMAVNKGVGFRLLTQVGKKSFARLGRGVPLVGGVLGAGLDAYMLKQISDHVRREFPPKAAAMGQLSS